MCVVVYQPEMFGSRQLRLYTSLPYSSACNDHSHEGTPTAEFSLALWLYLKAKGFSNGDLFKSSANAEGRRDGFSTAA